MTNYQELLISDLNDSDEQLRQRFQQMGYLYFKKAANIDSCNAIMQDFLNILSPHIIFDENLQLPVLNGQPFFETDDIWDRVYPQMQSLERFHSFFHSAEMQALMQRLLQKKPFVYPMKMARIATPKKLGYETPPHQDAHSHQAGPTMAGMWVALHDVNEDMGRLMMLAGSHKKGVRKVFEAAGVGGVQCEVLPDENNWHVSNVEQGDMIIFHSCCVHKAEPNTAKKAVRLSIDTRFSDYGAPLFVSNLEPHHGWSIDGLNWDAIYQQWSDDSLQYYWKDYPDIFDQLRYFAS